MEVLLERPSVTPNDVVKTDPSLLGGKRGHTCVVKMLLKRYHVSRDLANLIGEITFVQIPEEYYGGVEK